MDPVKLGEFIAKWEKASASERANAQHFILDLCDLLGVPRPKPSTGRPEQDDYAFERDAFIVGDGGRETVGKMDLYKRGCLLLEAKQGADEGSEKRGVGRRGSAAWNLAMQDALGQAIGYARTLDDPPPFLVACDVGYCFDLYACFDGSRTWRPYPHARNNRIHLRDMEERYDDLRYMFTDPMALDPARYSAKVTREIAGHLAELAKSLEGEGHEQVLVAKFLMRCLFTMFAEDVHLLREGSFREALEMQWLKHPERFKDEIEALWEAMNTGGKAIGFGRLLRFNGGLFAEPVALPLRKEQLETLLAAARCRWEDVEPAIFGTLLERALDPRERHRLGAHYTPRAYVERLVRPTIEEPLREDWQLVQAEVRQLVGKDDLDGARKAAQAFLDKLCHVRVLDPACGTGNFLYVTLDLFKRLEAEVTTLLASLGGQDALSLHRWSVSPEQFLGIEVKPWAKEIAELVLWIGYLQWEFRTRRATDKPAEPVLRNYGNIECRDAVLAWDGEPEPLIGEDGKPVTRWDGVTYKTHPVTGEEVPDETARVPVLSYRNPRKAEWPKADFVIGNPPYIGKSRRRQALGDGYLEALTTAYPEVPDGADYVMWWWFKAAEAVAAGSTRRAGLITTNSITQALNRRVVEKGLGRGIRIAWAVPDHPWVDSESGAAVRVAMTVTASGEGRCTLLTVAAERSTGHDHLDLDFRVTESMLIHPDLRVGSNLLAALPLAANAGISHVGLVLFGQGFLVESDDADSVEETVLHPYLTAREVVQARAHRRVIDLYPLTENQARQAAPMALNHVSARVKPDRDQMRDRGSREKWWRFGRDKAELREAMSGLADCIITPEVSKHRIFARAPSSTRCDHTLIVFAASDNVLFGTLSSRIHAAWAAAAGSRLGVGNDLRYNKSRCFDPFPFPAPTDAQAARIRELGERLDAHRKRQQELHPELTLTGMYNVLEKLRSGEALTAKEKVIHEQGLVSVLKQIHDELDAAVFDAYGWPHDLTDEQILERLVKLNAERAEEEKRGLIRWLRPDYQIPRVGKRGAVQDSLVPDEEAPKPAAKKAALPAWPKTLPERVAAVRSLVTRGSRPWSTDDVVASFAKPAKTSKPVLREQVEEVLDALAALGIVVAYTTASGKRWQPPARTAA